MGCFDIVAEATNGEEAIAAALEHRPDVVVMDVNMPGINGIEATRTIVQRCPSVGVLVLTMFEDDDSVFAALRAGARGYVVKGANEGEIVRAVHAVASGEAIFSGPVAARVLQFFSSARSASNVSFPELTDREREVLELIASGLDNVSIARRLTLSAKTVRNHVSNVFTKLHVANRAEAIVRAREAGFGSHGDGRH